MPLHVNMETNMALPVPGIDTTVCLYEVEGGMFPTLSSGEHWNDYCSHSFPFSGIAPE